MSGHDTDQALEEIGERLFRPRRAKGPGDGLPLPAAGRLGANAVREEIGSTVRWAPQVMVKVTGGGRGIDAIRAHLSYISKRGAREIEDQDGDRHTGGDAIGDLIGEWRYAGTLIPRVSDRREAFNITLSMPRGTEPELVLAATRLFARREFEGHRYAMVLHTHQANPHVHLVVRAENEYGRRLNPRKADLRRYRERFAAELRSLGVDAAATRQALRGRSVRAPALWELKAGRLKRRPSTRAVTRIPDGQVRALRAWRDAARYLARSDTASDRELSIRIVGFVREAFVPSTQRAGRERGGREMRAPTPRDRD